MKKKNQFLKQLKASEIATFRLGLRVHGFQNLNTFVGLICLNEINAWTTWLLHSWELSLFESSILIWNLNIVFSNSQSERNISQQFPIEQKKMIRPFPGIWKDCMQLKETEILYIVWNEEENSKEFFNNFVYF